MQHGLKQWVTEVRKLFVSRAVDEGARLDLVEQHGPLDLFEGGGFLDDFLKKVLRTQNVRFAGEQGDNDEIRRHDCGACCRCDAPTTINEDNVIFAPEWFDFLME